MEKELAEQGGLLEGFAAIGVKSSDAQTTGFLIFIMCILSSTIPYHSIIYDIYI